MPGSILIETIPKKSWITACAGTKKNKKPRQLLNCVRG
jgi:hypothetical protein